MMLFKSIIQYVYLENFLFVFFTILLIFSSFLVILVNNSVYSALFLVLCFISASGMLFLLECEFIALLFLIIYVGAIAILFLFVIMMLDIKSTEFPKDILKYLPVGSLIGLFLLLEFMFLINNTFNMNPYCVNSTGINFSNYYENWYSNLDAITDIVVVGQVLYTHFILQLLLTGLILLLAVIGTVSLTMSSRSVKSKKQIIFKQISRNYKNILLS